MRVALLCGRYAPERDGVAGYVQRLSEALGAAGVAAEVREWPGLRRWRDPDADLLHVQFAPSAFGYSGAVGLLPPRSRLPLVTTLHEYGWWTWRPAPGVAAASRLAARTRRWDPETLRLAPASRRLVVTNDRHRRVIRDRLCREADVIPIGANVGRSYPGSRMRARAELAVPEEASLVVFFGFLHPVKGVRHLIDALAALRAGGRDVRLAVVGGWRSLAWPDAEADAFASGLAQQIAALGLEAAVTVTGHLPEIEVSRWLTAADVAALPFTAGLSAKSGSLATCWAHGLPVVAPDPDPEIATAVASCRPRDAGTLATALDVVLSDPALRARLSAVAAARARAAGWETVASAHLAVYRSVLGRSG